MAATAGVSSRRGRHRGLHTDSRYQAHTPVLRSLEALQAEWLRRKGQSSEGESPQEDSPTDLERRTKTGRSRRVAPGENGVVATMSLGSPQSVELVQTKPSTTAQCDAGEWSQASTHGDFQEVDEVMRPPGLELSGAQFQATRFEIEALLRMRPQGSPRQPDCPVPITLELPRQAVPWTRNNGTTMKANEAYMEETLASELALDNRVTVDKLMALESSLEVDGVPFFEEEADDETSVEQVPESRGLSKWFGIRNRSASGAGAGETNISTDAGSGDESSSEDVVVSAHPAEVCLPMIRGHNGA
mmetsp:Transcript_6844/g.12055  ORF Transcript_6844/g.12055 Transcript_6844/m.12055 type:complete len:302 (-) Transcript_6844:127-1032(-)